MPYPLYHGQLTEGALATPRTVVAEKRQDSPTGGYYVGTISSLCTEAPSQGRDNVDPYDNAQRGHPVFALRDKTLLASLAEGPERHEGPKATSF